MNKRSRRALTAVKALRLFTVSGCSEFAAGAVTAAAGIMVIAGVFPDAGLGGVGVAVVPLRQVKSLGGDVHIRLRALADGLHFCL